MYINFYYKMKASHYHYYYDLTFKHIKKYVYILVTQLKSSSSSSSPHWMIFQIYFVYYDRIRLWITIDIQQRLASDTPLSIFFFLVWFCFVWQNVCHHARAAECFDALFFIFLYTYMYLSIWCISACDIFLLVLFDANACSIKSQNYAPIVFNFKCSFIWEFLQSSLECFFFLDMNT